MDHNLFFSTERSRQIYEESLKKPGLTEALLQESLKLGNYDAALRFANNLAMLMPDSYKPIHDKCAVLFQEKKLGDIGIALAECEDKFGDNPFYINDRLAYTVDILGTAAAKKYLDKIKDKQITENEDFLNICARIYEAEGDEKKYIQCLFILHKQYGSEKARFLLALKSAEYEKWEAALKWFTMVINARSGSPEYFMSLAGRSSILKLLNRENWQDDAKKAAIEIDVASSVHIMNVWLRSISEGLWTILNEPEKADFNHKLLVELEKYSSAPKQYLHEQQ